MALNEQQIRQLQAAIEKRRAALEEELDEEQASGLPPSEADEADTRRDLAELKALEEAAARLAEGSYGRCVDCGVDIPFQRLQAAPHASRCLPCQAQSEKTGFGTIPAKA